MTPSHEKILKVRNLFNGPFGERMRDTIKIAVRKYIKVSKSFVVFN
jgi:hypothetical protein